MYKRIILAVDLADLVWLQFIKDGNPALYRWIEEYCGTAAAVSLRTARVEDAEKAQQLNVLVVGVGVSKAREAHAYTCYTSCNAYSCWTNCW